MLNEDESFSLTANVTSPGYQRVVLKGFLTETRNGEVWAAPLLPQLFYGADGLPLTTWRQDLTSAGSQVILSRSGGLPTVPHDELYWRKIRDAPVTTEPTTKLEYTTPDIKNWLFPAALISVLFIGSILFLGRKK